MEETEGMRILRQTVREFAESEIAPHVMEWDEAQRFPMELVPKMAELGLFGPTLPEAYGGLDLGSVAYGLMMMELERGDSGLRSFASVQGALAMYAIYRYGSEDQRQRWLPPMARGERIGCFGLTEPDAGSDPGAMRTRARLDGDAYVLDGTKRWITNGTIADVAVVWARDDAGEIGGFLVERDSQGFSAPEIETKASMRASVTSELILEGVRVPLDARLPGAKGLGAPLSCLTQARYGIAWGALGAAEFCFETARRYTLERKQFGRALAANQLVQKKLADMLCEIGLGLQACLRVGRMKDEGTASTDLTSIIKRNSCGKALDIARTARDMLGGNGISDEFGVARHLVNLEVVNTYEGTHDIHALILGRAITGIAAFGG